MVKKQDKKKKDKKRVDLDVRPYPSPWWKNYDYGGPEEGESEVSPGRGLYSGKMDKYKSVKDFIEKSRARMQKKRRKALAHLFEKINRNAQIKKNAIIIKGNPVGIARVPWLANKFYTEIKQYLEGLGFDVAIRGSNESPAAWPKADLWVGHSKGADVLTKAPQGTNTVALGVEWGIHHPDDTFEPNEEHFTFTDEMKQEIAKYR